MSGREITSILCGLLATACLSAGCAASQAGRSTVAKPSGAATAELARRQFWQRQAQRLSELEARIALLEAEARQSRTSGVGKISETVTIGAGAAAAEREPRAADGPPPIKLTLHGRPRASASAEPLEPVPVVSERLPVVPLPGERAKGTRVAVSNEDTALAGGPDRAPQSLYHRALGLLRDRKYNRAVAAFRQFADGHPEHDLASSAIYWQGEARYAMREYPQALAAFARVIESYPTSQKVSKALYKLGLCHQRLGDQSAARRWFERLRAEFPDSELAKRTSVEGSS